MLIARYVSLYLFLIGARSDPDTRGMLENDRRRGRTLHFRAIEAGDAADEPGTVAAHAVVR